MSDVGRSLLKSLADNAAGDSMATRIRRTRFALFLSLTTADAPAVDPRRAAG